MSSASLFFSRPGEPTLRYEVRAPEGAPVGSVFLTHGYAEHSGRYRQVIDALVARGLVVASYDLRGHGHSEGPRGYVERFEEYLRDARALLGHLRSDAAFAAGGKPVLLGHSLGGLITFLLSLEMADEARGVILSSPFFGLALKVAAPKRAAAVLLSRLVPRFGLPSELRGKDLTHDSRLAQAYDSDPLLVKSVPSRWFTEALQAQKLAFDRASSLRLPLLLLHGGADKVASAEASRELFARVTDPRKELRVLDDQYHEIFNELDRDRWIHLAVEAAVRFCAPPSLAPRGQGVVAPRKPLAGADGCCTTRWMPGMRSIHNLAVVLLVGWLGSAGPGCGGGDESESLFSTTPGGAGASQGAGKGGQAQGQAGQGSQGGVAGGKASGGAGAGPGAGQAGSVPDVFGAGGFPEQGGAGQGQGAGGDPSSGGFGGDPSAFGGFGGDPGPGGPGGGPPTGGAQVQCQTQNGGPPNVCLGGCCLINNVPNACTSEGDCNGNGVFGFMGCDSPDDCPGGECCVGKQNYESQCRSSCSGEENRMCKPKPGPGGSPDCSPGQSCQVIGETQLYFECVSNN